MRLRILFFSCLLFAAFNLEAANKKMKSTTYTVVIENMVFNPAKLEAKQGDKIIWVNKDLVPHTVTDIGKTFDSGSIPPGDKWTYKLKGTPPFSYHCLFHPTMSGSIETISE